MVLDVGPPPPAKRALLFAATRESRLTGKRKEYSAANLGSLGVDEFGPGIAGVRGFRERGEREEP